MNKNNSIKNTKNISLIGFFAITASMVMTVYEYPAFATSKITLVFLSFSWRLFIVYSYCLKRS